MRLTAELIQNSLTYINPLTERELDLRGHKIPAIENLGVARDLNDSIDLTDNSLTTLSNFPHSPRLRSLLVAHNRITHIQPSLANSIPRLTTLVLTGNRLKHLADLDPLGAFTHLTHLSLLDNPVARHEHYRSWVLWRCRSVRFLDFQKVKEAEREKAVELFGEDEDSMTDLAKGIARTKSAGGADSGAAGAADGPGRAGRVKLTDKEKKRVEKMIREAKSLSEIARLEKELNEGRVPGGVQGDDSDDEMEE